MPGAAPGPPSRFGVAQNNPRHLRRPVLVEHFGEVYRFLTIGYLAEAVGRTPRTIRRWQEVGLLPKPEIFLYPRRLPAKRGLYPEGLVTALRQVASRGGIGPRLEWQEWDRFRDEAWSAYEVAMRPLRTGAISLME